MAETIHVRGEGGVVWEMDLPLPDGVAQRLANGDLTRLNKDGSPYEEPTEDLAGPQDGPPAKAASKAAWVDYAVDAHGVEREEAEKMTKADLVELYGG